MYAVGLGRGVRMADLTTTLSRLADASGGRAVIAPDTSALSGAFHDVVDELAHQYSCRMGQPTTSATARGGR